MSTRMAAKRMLNHLCAKAVQQQIERGEVEAGHLRNRRRYLARQILKRIPHSFRLAPKQLLHAAVIVLATWGVVGISMPMQAQAAPMFKHTTLAGFDVGRDAIPTFVDIDGDGDLDAFVGSDNETNTFIGRRAGSAVKFYRNTGSNTAPVFTPANGTTIINPLAGFSKHYAVPTFADIDGDGDLDVFIGLGGFPSGGTVLFYRNTGTAAAPVFTADAAGNPLAGVHPGGNAAYNSVGVAAPTFTDIDGDGDLDAFVGEYGGAVQFYLNAGSNVAPVFVAADGVSILNPLTDINLNSSSHRRNKGNRLVSPVAAPAFVDIDNDGDLDAFVGSRDGKVIFARNVGTRAAPIFAVANGGTISNPLAGVDVDKGAAPTFVDIDGDGDLDAFVGEYDGAVRFYRNTGTAAAPVFTADVQDHLLSVIGAWRMRPDTLPTLADIDGDGDLDLFVGTSWFYDNSRSKVPSQVRFYRNTGTAAAPTFTADAAGNPLTGLNAGLIGSNDQPNPILVDIDGDGDLDLFVGRNVLSWMSNKSSFNFYRNTGSVAVPVFTADSAASPLAGIQVGKGIPTPAFVDIDNDGDFDLFVDVAFYHAYNGTRSVVAHEVQFYRNTGTALAPVFTAADGITIKNPLAGFQVRAGKATFADIDGDGDFDAFIGQSDGSVQFYRNTGTATAPMFVADAAVNPLAGFDVGGNAVPSFVDIDNDGDLDAVVGGAGGRVDFFRNTGSSVGFNHPPVPTAPSISSNFNTISIIQIAPNDPDIGDTHIFAVTTVAVDGIATVDANGQAMYIPNRGYSGADSFVVTVTDSGGLSISVTVHVNVTLTASTDVTAPMLTAPASISVAAMSVSGTQASDAAIAAFLNGATATDTVGIVGTITHDAPFTFPAGKMTTVTFSAIDAADNTGTATARVTVSPFVAPVKPAPIAVFKHTSLAEFNVGGRATPVFVDIDNDGDLDAFVGVRYAVHFYRNTGTATAPVFTADTVNNPLAGFVTRLENHPSFIDIDNDGDFDAFIGDYNGKVRFFRNTGTAAVPVFVADTAGSPSVGFDVGSRAAPAFVDIDGDGDPDLFVGNAGGAVRFYRNTGTAAMPVFIATNTLDPSTGQPMLDPNTGQPIPNIDPNTGQPIVNPLASFGGASTTNVAPAFVDIDNDGDLDVFIGTGNAARFYRNTGTATAPIFTAEAAANPLAGIGGQRFAAPAFVDIDADGDPDLFVGQPSGEVRLYRNTGTALAPVFIAGVAGNPLADFHGGFDAIPTLVDIDNDGDMDVFVGIGGVRFYRNTGTSIVSAFTSEGMPDLRTGNPIINPLAGLNSRRSLGASSLTFLDIDHDGDLDFFVRGDDRRPGVHFYRNTDLYPRLATTPVFTADVSSLGVSFDHYSITAPVFVDIDHDGDLDIFFGDGSGAVRFSRNTGTAAVFTADKIRDPNTGLFMAGVDPNTGQPIVNPLVGVDMGSSPTAPSFADIDFDGDLDAFVGKGGAVRFYRNTGTATVPVFTAATIRDPNSGQRMAGVDPNTGQAVVNPLASLHVDAIAAPVFADMDSDGDLDVLIGGSAGAVLFYRNTGTAAIPVFTAGTAENPLSGAFHQAAVFPTFVDIDNDGDADLFLRVHKGTIFRGSNGTVKFYRNTGTNTIPVFMADTNPLADLTGTHGVSSLSFADIDGDGDLDAFVGDDVGGDKVHFYRNAGTAATPVFVADAAGDPLTGGVSHPIFVDIDNDGDLDVFGGRGVPRFLRNTGTATTPVFTGDVAGNPLVGMNVGSTENLRFVDVDHDGDLDAFAGSAEFGNGGIRFFLNIGTNTAPKFVNDIVGNPLASFHMAGSAHPALVDIDNDGDFDVFIGDSFGRVHFLENFDRRPVTVADNITSVASLGETIADVTANDHLSKANGTAANFAVTAFTQGANGTVIRVPGSNGFTYTPNPGFTGTDAFTYTVSDGIGNTTIGMVNVRAVNANVPPVPTAPTITTNEDTSAVSRIAPHDPDLGDSHSYVVTTPAVHGVAIVNAGGVADFTAAPNWNGTDSFVVTVTDNAGAMGIVTINVTVNAVNDAPVPSATIITFNEGGSGSSQIVPNDPDVVDTHFYSITTPPINGIATVDATGVATYIPNAGFFGADSFIAMVTDAAGAMGTINVPVVVNAYTSYTYPLTKGWSLISFPMDLGATGLMDFLTAAPRVVAVWSLGNRGWQSFIASLSAMPNTLTSLKAGKGYWVKETAGNPKSVRLGGPAVSVTPHLLPGSGWNLIGVTTPVTDIAGFASQTGADSVWTFTDGQWSSFIVGTPVFLNSLQRMDIGLGYYVHIK